ncbi:MAG: SGNH/GDSL hydrolase family protein [Rhodopirellula sp.]|nr:SGNH/GDSL hydrolase family protein [Rhodopirellula sp.]
MWQLFLHLSDGYLLAMAVWLVILGLTPVVLVRLRRKWTAQKSRLKIVYAGLSAWLCVGLLTLPEVGFALFYDTTDSFDMTNVSHRWFKVHVEPDVRVLEFSDDTGIRYRADSDVVLSPPSGVRHICFLGDSFTFGHGVADVADRFSDRVSRLMKDAGSGSESVAVSNLAWPGTDLIWAESVLQHSFESGGRIDDAVYVLCLNDIEAFHDPTMTRSSSLALFEPPGFFFRDTYFFNWLYFRTQLLFRAETRGYYSFVKEYYQGEPWHRFREELARTSVLCRNHGCRFRVAIFPFLHNLGAEYPFREIHHQIVIDCEDSGIDCLDLDPALSKHSNERLTVNPFDAHPNERAHEIAAAALEKWLAASRDKGGSVSSSGSQSLERLSGE